MGKKIKQKRSLRAEAEEKLGQTTGAFPEIKEKTSDELIHELRVHQIELEMQNEELRNAQLALEEARDKYMDLYDFSPVGYFTFTSEALIKEVNLAGAALLGIERGKLINQGFGRFVSGKDLVQWDRHIMNLLELGKKLICEISLKRGDGSMFHAQIESITMDSNSGTAVIRSAVSDITERKKSEVTLNRYAEKLRRSNEELQQFAYVTSHDLQEPLRMIASYLQLIESRYKGKLDKDADEFIAFSVDGAARLQDMITGLLSYSSVGTKRKPFDDVNCSEVLGHVISNLKVAIEESGALVTSDRLPVIKADGGQLVQVFQNLISNAIKFRGADLPRIHVSAEQKETEWVFSVRDSGIGIAPEYKNRIFKIFQRLHGREYPGVGIGLSICRRIVESHGGRIWFESEYGKGTTFYYAIPKRQETDE